MLSCGVCFFLSILYFAVLLYFVFSSTGCVEVGRESKDGGVEVACRVRPLPPPEPVPVILSVNAKRHRRPDVYFNHDVQ